ncbi:MAG: twin-arginine translocation signal domain-containing protein, partial [Verrucomicrobia bacterium]|nr:twin-arginine translocation signal domain-containing protein [Verrucomicrobiota bacterium]
MNRRNFIKRMGLGAAALAVLPRLNVEAEENTNVVFEPKDHGRALVNPSMGWTMHYYSNIISNYGSKLEPSDTLDDFPGLSTVYLRVPWS